MPLPLNATGDRSGTSSAGYGSGDRQRGRRRRVSRAIGQVGGAFGGTTAVGTAAATVGTVLALTTAFTSSQIPAGKTVQAAAVSGANAAVSNPDRPQAARGSGTRPGAGKQSLSQAGAALAAPAQRSQHRLAGSGTVRGRTAPSSAGSTGTSASRLTLAFSALDGIPGITSHMAMGTGIRRTATASGSARSTRRTSRPQAGRQPRQAGLDEVIRLAKKQNGIREDKRGRNKFTEWYASSRRARETAERDGGKPADYRAAAWCDMFVSWVADQTRSTSMGSDAYTVKHAKWFESKHRWGHRPQPGALAFFAWEPSRSNRRIENIDHVGLVAKVNRDGTFQTVEGNVNDRVEVRTRSTSQVAGFGYTGLRR